ncbi:MAG: 30S ribosome-binding factor RbfA [Deltaproteobacteria bacterium]|nr:30S ribosome-binding factor RbfA [Deltaproteobacteria bacterium]
MKGERIARVNRMLQSALAELVPARVRDPRVQKAALVAVTGVQTSGDLRVARVFVCVNGERAQAEEVLAGLKQASGFLRAELGRRVSLRHTPELRFELDEAVATGARIEAILKELGQTKKEEDHD